METISNCRLKQIVRLMCSKALSRSVLVRDGTVSKDPSLKPIRHLLPHFIMRMFDMLHPDREMFFYFYPLNTKHKGKKRVYVCNNKSSKLLFMWYLDKSTYRKLHRGNTEIPGPLPNVWVITKRKYEFTGWEDLTRAVIAMTPKSTRSNHPPADIDATGTKDCLWAWDGPPKIVCRLIKTNYR